jgi:hypothetical protein
LISTELAFDVGWLVLACGAEVLPVEVDCVLVAACAV